MTISMTRPRKQAPDLGTHGPNGIWKENSCLVMNEKTQSWRA